MTGRSYFFRGRDTEELAQVLTEWWVEGRGTRHAGVGQVSLQNGWHLPAQPSSSPSNPSHTPTSRSISATSSRRSAPSAATSALPALS